MTSFLGRYGFHRMVWLDIDSYLHKERFWVFLTLVSATWYMFSHVLANCTFKVHFFHCVPPLLLCPVLLVFYFLASCYTVMFSVSLLFLLSWGTCCCIFVLLVSKDIAPLRSCPNTSRTAHFSSFLYVIARFCPPCFLVWLLKATRVFLKPRSQDIWRNSWKLWVLRECQLSSNHQ